jgi:aminoglycoside phosphotransferase (APT) family kinase protein
MQKARGNLFALMSWSRGAVPKRSLHEIRRPPPGYLGDEAIKKAFGEALRQIHERS